jgi:RNA polymerase II-associated protein 2
MPPKSILKKSAPPPPTDDSNAVAALGASSRGSKPVNQRHLQVALHHANVLEDRKRVEAEVLDAIMTLMDYPSSETADPKRPAASDAQYFREAVVPFQPADYDSLIEERNIGGKCGYALCPRPKQKARSTAKKQFVDTEHGVEIVDRKVLEVWCSDDCAKRALYVKVQLNEEPAWLRSGGYGGVIDLMIDDSAEAFSALPIRLKNDKAIQPSATGDEDDDIEAAWAAREDAMADLALERGEKPGQVTKANNDLVKDQIKERETSSAPPKAPSSQTLGSEHTMAIEGHIPRTDRKDEDEDEDDPQDWDKRLPG